MVTDDPITYLIWAIILGTISSISLPLGSIIGLQVNIKPNWLSALAAFGAGALIAALSIELVAPTVFSLEHIPEGANPDNVYASFYAMLLGAVSGGLLFVLLDRILSAYGGFLRRTSSTIAYVTSRTHSRQLDQLEKLSAFPLLKDLSGDHINSLMRLLRPVSYAPGEVIARQGEPGTELFFIVAGTVDATSDTGLETCFLSGNVTGLIPIIMGTPHPGTLTSREAVSGYVLSKEATDQLRSLAPEFDLAVRDLTTRSLEQLEQLIASRDEQSMDWLEDARQALATGAQIPDALQLRRARAEHEGAPLAIWLGILIDGIPESFVIGAGLLVLIQASFEQLGELRFIDVVPYTLIAGLFLSNFPEALASSSNMQRQGWSKRRIFLLWLSLMLITAVGAGAGYLLADSLSHPWLIFAQGLAAGAMLTMIAAAMIPDAVHLGSASGVGLSTLIGFLAAISFKLLET